MTAPSEEGNALHTVFVALHPVTAIHCRNVESTYSNEKSRRWQLSYYNYMLFRLYRRPDTTVWNLLLRLRGAISDRDVIPVSFVGLKESVPLNTTTSKAAVRAFVVQTDCPQYAVR